MSRGNPRVGFRAPPERVAAYEAAAEREDLEISEWLRRAADRALLPGQSGPPIEDRTPPRAMGDVAGPPLEPAARGKIGEPAPPLRSITGVALPGGARVVEERERQIRAAGKRFRGPDPKKR